MIHKDSFVKKRLVPISYEMTQPYQVIDFYLNNQNLNWAHNCNTTSFPPEAVQKRRITVTKKPFWDQG